MDSSERETIRARHYQGEAALSLFARCVYDGDLWPCDTVKLANFADTADAFLESWAGLWPVLVDEYGCTLNCDEAEAAAALLRAFGRPASADSLLDDHAAHDTEEDSHYERGVELLRAAREEALHARSGRNPFSPGTAGV